MLTKLFLYSNTIRKIQPGQIYARIRKTLGLNNTLGVLPKELNDRFFIFQPTEELDFDSFFLARFNADEFEKGKLTFLHESETIEWDSEWKVPSRSALWNFNLHYFEYLMSYIKAYRESKEIKYLNAIKTCINGWIEHNPIHSGGNGWAPYTISLRLIYWFSCLNYLFDELDEDFRKRMIGSIYEQYTYLAGHLEKDLLANHYFEDLKALILCSLFFCDERMLVKSIIEFKKQCKEQILPDGMHFELSPMYHKIVLEDVIRVAVALRSADKADTEIESYIKPMIDVAYTFEEGLERIPLFNDGGNNIAKSLEALLLTAKNHFNIMPTYKSNLPDSGYYFYKWNDWKLIVDAGLPGPKYNDGHAHCDAMSFELFHQGKPIVINCGTYAYQCNERVFFRSTAAHNTVMINGVEQSQCWSGFRTGKTSQVKVLGLDNRTISMELTDQQRQKIKRTILINSNGITVIDKSKGKSLSSYVHMADDNVAIRNIIGNAEEYKEPYSIDYGEKRAVTTLEIRAIGELQYTIDKNGISDIPRPIQERQALYRGYKPLAFINGKLILYANGKLWKERNGVLCCISQMRNETWKDKNRLLIRLFRGEPKFAVPIDDHRVLVAGYRKLILIDLDNRDVKVIFYSRDHFSDPLNICLCRKNWLALWGDYGSNPDHEAVQIYGLKTDLSVETVYSFSKGQIRHVHNIIPKITGGYYIFTGDQEAESGIYETDDLFSIVRPYKLGKQKYRAVVGFDTTKGLLYATDAVNEKNYVYLLNEKEHKVICSLNGSVIYGKKYKNDFYFATTVEPDENNRGLFSWISNKRGAGINTNEVTLVKINERLFPLEMNRYKKDFWPMKLMQYGTIMFPWGDGDDLWIYPVAVTKTDGCAINLSAGNMN